MQTFNHQSAASFRWIGAFVLSAGLWAQSPLTIVSSLPTGAVGQSYSALVVTGGTPPYSLSTPGSTLPPGLALFSSGSTAFISGTPTSGGTYSFTLMVTDSRGTQATKSLSLTIGGGSQLAVSSKTLPPGVSGQAYSQQLSANGGSPPYQWTPLQTLPAGLTLSSAGLVAGTPTAAGTFSFTVQVTDAAKASVTGSISLTIQTAPMSITTQPPLFTGTVGSAYAQSFAAIGGQQPYKWIIASGNTDGLTLDPNSGSLTGTPQTAGTFTFTIQVSDNSGNSAVASFSLTVNPPNLTISVGAALRSGTVGAAYSQKLPVQATGGTTPYTWSLTGTPDGLTFDPTTLLLSGTPTTPGTFTLSVQVNDSSGLTATKSLSLTIASAGLTITTSRQLPDAVLSVAYAQTLTGSGGQPPYRWSANGLPAGLTINPSSGLISGTPTAAGAFGVAVTITDAALANYSDRFTMNVNLPQPPPVMLSGLPVSASPAQQYTVQVSLGSMYPAAITGQAIITFVPDTGPTDRTIQFSSGGTTASFNIPAGSTTNDVPLAIQTGTVSGTITISLRLQAGGIDITPTPTPAVSTSIARLAPVIRSTQMNLSGNTLNIVVTGYSTAREVTQAVFTFRAASGQTLQSTASSIVVDVTSLFGNWFVDPANSQFGSIFIFTQPFSVQGDPAAVIPVSVTLTNRVGSTTASIPQ